VGMSQRAAAYVRKMSAERYAQRAAEDARLKAEADAYHAAFLDRERAADFLGISVHKLKRMMAAGTGPACQKNGDTKQATFRWPLVELERWKADPGGYTARRDATLPQ
jgi:hypothetical protein